MDSQNILKCKGCCVDIISKNTKIFADKMMRLHDYEYIARDKNGDISLYTSKPVKTGGDFWDYSYNFSSFYPLIEEVMDCDFSNIKWEDEEPTKLEDIVNS